MRFVELEEARNAGGLRLVVVGGVPSPWSEAAKAIFAIKGIDHVAVRFDPRDREVKAWTGCHNAPVAMFDGEPARSGWGEILALAERLNPGVPLVPESADARIRVYGIAHELLGEGGLAWSARLTVIHDGLVSKGERGFPERLAAYLAPKYGYLPERIPAARERVLSALRHVAGLLEENRRQGSSYLVGERLSVADICLVATLDLLRPLPADVCPIIPPIRHALETLEPALREAVPDVLLRHRDMMFEKHLALPREL